MQKKTIDKNIRNKMSEWIETISDEKLKTDLESNILVSGGSIASMFLGEDVNDYDVYIKDLSVLVRLSKYYTKKYENITVVSKLNRESLISEFSESFIVDLTEMKGEYLNGKVLSIKNTRDDQVKLIFEELNGGFQPHTDGKAKEGEYRVEYFSPNAISLSNDVQVVTRFHGDNEQIHKTFDFIHATNYWTFETGLVTNIRAVESLLTKRLVYQGSLYPVTSIIRMKKFINRGWSIGAGEILKIVFQCSELDLTNIEILENQLIGVDVAYFGQLIECLKVEKKEEMDSSYLNGLIDKIFNE